MEMIEEMELAARNGGRSQRDGESKAGGRSPANHCVSCRVYPAAIAAICCRGSGCAPCVKFRGRRIQRRNRGADAGKRGRYVAWRRRSRTPALPSAVCLAVAVPCVGLAAHGRQEKPPRTRGRRRGRRKNVAARKTRPRRWWIASARGGPRNHSRGARR
jgi:hypothetical protein